MTDISPEALRALAVDLERRGEMRAAAALRKVADEKEAAGGRPTGTVEIAHDGFAGDIIGHYTTREGKRGVVVQQHGTRVVHVYGEKWITLEPRHD